ncbi:MAG: hypothetical protein H6559_33665 [Lewinellaceae bacterium]|nr:hypothetical protein [Lewinellaceae bacterium]
MSGGNNGQVGSVGQLGLAVGSSTGLFCGAATAPPADSTSISVAVDRFGNAYSLSQMAVPQNTSSGSTQQMRGYDGCDCDDLGINTDYFDI